MASVPMSLRMGEFLAQAFQFIAVALAVAVAVVEEVVIQGEGFSQTAGMLMGHQNCSVRATISRA